MGSGVEHGDRLQHSEQVIGHGAVELAGTAQLRELTAQSSGGVEPLIEVREVPGHRCPQIPGGIVERAADLAERQTETTQQTDLVEALHGVVATEPVATVAALRRDQEAGLLVVVQVRTVRPVAAASSRTRRPDPACS